jgi:hypothetical protein
MGRATNPQKSDAKKNVRASLLPISQTKSLFSFFVQRVTAVHPLSTPDPSGPSPRSAIVRAEVRYPGMNTEGKYISGSFF